VSLPSVPSVPYVSRFTIQASRVSRTMLGEKRVSARVGCAGEKTDFFNRLLHMIAQHKLLRMRIEIDLIPNVAHVKDLDVVLD